jgi:hypothetical protein
MNAVALAPEAASNSDWRKETMALAGRWNVPGHRCSPGSPSVIRSLPLAQCVEVGKERLVRFGWGQWPERVLTRDCMTPTLVTPWPCQPPLDTRCIHVCH